MPNKEISFEASMLSLEKVIEKLESGSTTLDEMVQLYEEGIKLTNACKSKLAAAEERITTLVNDNNDLKEVPGI
ncbi:MAG: exodeoxyribonuclease VII small subunit [Candidatus Marinimicrobia bacterium]|nr:exodeoxyribonuclease VII small subunit [Candidatus Neomarinimicrobiota bacterium]